MLNHPIKRVVFLFARTVTFVSVKVKILTESLVLCPHVLDTLVKTGVELLTDHHLIDGDGVEDAGHTH